MCGGLSSPQIVHMITRGLSYLFLFTACLNINVLMLHIPGLTASVSSLSVRQATSITVSSRSLPDFAVHIKKFQAAALDESRFATYATALCFVSKLVYETSRSKISYYSIIVPHWLWVAYRTIMVYLSGLEHQLVSVNMLQLYYLLCGI